jgi:hypothetical protein
LVVVKLLAAALILSTTIALAIAAFETRIFSPSPTNMRTKGIVWDGKTFAVRGDFARWLRSRGVRYGLWARRHPLVVGYATNPRVHPKAQAEARRARQKGSDWAVKSLGGVAVLTSLGLGVALVRRRWPGSSGGSGARPTLRWAAATGRLSSSLAKSSARTTRRSGTQFARSLARRAAPAAKVGARLMLRWANATALVSLSLGASSADTIRRRRSEFAWYLATALLAAAIAVVATVWLNRV